MPKLRCLSDPQWTELRDFWAQDAGALTDVYVVGTTTDDWQRVVDATKRRWSSTYTEDGVRTSLPNDAVEVFRRTQDRACLLSVELTPQIKLNAHFFSPEEVEFDFDPRDLRGQADLETVIEFVRTIGRALQQTVCIGIESAAPRPPEDLRYEPDLDGFVSRF